MKKEKQFLYVSKNIEGLKIWLENSKNPCFHFATFSNVEAAEKFLRRFGVSLRLKNIYNENVFCFLCDKVFLDAGYFWKKSKLPKDCRRIKALSNGSIVTCYYKKHKNKVKFYRPNPNEKKIYKPLSLDNHIKHQQKYGVY